MPKDLFIALIIICSIFAFADFIILIYSLLYGWNVPIKFTKSGIITRYNTEHKRKDVYEINVFEKIPIMYGPIYIIKCVYKDNKYIKLELTPSIKKCLLLYCEDVKFLDLFNKVLKEIENSKP